MGLWEILAISFAGATFHPLVVGLWYLTSSWVLTKEKRVILRITQELDEQNKCLVHFFYKRGRKFFHNFCGIDRDNPDVDPESSQVKEVSNVVPLYTAAEDLVLDRLLAKTPPVQEIGNIENRPTVGTPFTLTSKGRRREKLYKLIYTRLGIK